MSDHESRPRASGIEVAAIAGGVGAAKLLVGLQRVLGPSLTAVINTADDAVIYGVHVSPDVDICTYWLAGIADTDRGWGILGDSFEVVGAMRALGIDAWFNLGDRDFATCLYRTERLAAGATLAEVTAGVAGRLEVAARLLPMSNHEVRTRVATSDGRTLDFQEYFVKERTRPEVAEVRFAGIADAAPAPGVLEAIERADVVIVCPSNPVVSTGPILGLRGVRDALRDHKRVIAVSPIVNGAALKGPADRMLASLGSDVSPTGVARLYADFVDVFVLDQSDASHIDSIDELGVGAAGLDTIMSDHDASERLARELLGL